MIYKKDTISKISTNSNANTLDNYSDLTYNQRLALLSEQALIERMTCLQEIKDLRELLDKNNINADNIANWLERSDIILDKLLRYKLGKCGKLVRKQSLSMPYSWRRKFRKLYPPSV